MSLADDIAAARQGGRSDSQILDAYKAFDPSKAAEIQGAIDAGHSPSDVLDALGAYDAQYGNHVENQSLLQKGIGALRQGVSDELSGISNTSKLANANGVSVPDGVSSALDQGAGIAKPDAPYQPANAGLGDTSKTLLDRAGYIPRAMVEGAPGMATDLAAGGVGARVGGAIGMLGGPLAELTVPAGAAIGGALGFGGSYALRNFGNDAKSAAVARTGDQTAQPNTDDMQRAALADAMGAGLSRVGLKAGLGGDLTKTGGSVALNALTGAGKAAAVDGLTSAAQDAAHTAIIDQKNPLDDPTGLGLSALQGAATGTTLRAVPTARDAVQAAKFSDIDLDMGSTLATLYQGKDFSNTSKAFDAVNSVDNHLNDQASYWQTKAAPQLKALQDANGHTDDTDLLLRGVRTDIGNGTLVPSARLDDLDERLGDFHEGANLVNTLRLQNSQNLIKQAGNFDTDKGTFGGGIASTDLFSKYINPTSQVGSKAGLVGALSYLTGGHVPVIGHALPTIGAASLIGQLGLMGAAKGVDRLIGNDNPLKSFNAKFGGDATSAPATPSDHTIQGLPSFTQTLADHKAQEAQATAQAKSQYSEANTTNTIADRTAMSVGELAKKALLSQRATQERAEAAKTNEVARDTARQVGQAARNEVLDARRDDAAQDPMFPGVTKAQATAMRAQIAAINNAQRAVKTERAPSESIVPNVTKAQMSALRQQVSALTNLDRMKAKEAKRVSAEQKAQASAANDDTDPVRQARARTARQQQQQPQPQPKMQSTGATPAGFDSVSHQGHTIVFSTDGKHNLPAYKAGIKQNMVSRQEVFDTAKSELPKAAHPVLDLIHNSLNGPTLMTAHDAEGVVSDIANEHPEYTGAILDALDKPKLWSTFKRK